MMKMMHIFDGASGGMYLTPQVLQDANGRIRYQTDRNKVVEKILPADRKVWIPVSRERWVKTLIARSEETLEKQRLEITEGAEERPAAPRFSWILKTTTPCPSWPPIRNFSAPTFPPWRSSR